MEKITILKTLQEIRNNDDMDLLKELEEKLKDDIRKDICYKTSSKDRVKALEKMMKYNTKAGREFLKGYIEYGSMYAFTNAYYIVAINDNLGYDKSTANYNITYMLDFNTMEGGYYSNIKETNLDLNDLLFKYKTKEQYYTVDNVKFDTVFLKEVLDILGSDTKIYNTTEDKTKTNCRLFFENSKGEKALLLGIKEL